MKRDLLTLLLGLAALSLAAVILYLVSCHDFGESGKLAEGKRLGAQAVVALEKYKSAHGQYPNALSALYPGFLKAPLKELRVGHTDGVTFIYVLHAGGAYELTFHYTGPGVNNCTLRPRSQPQEWQCTGLY